MVVRFNQSEFSKSEPTNQKLERTTYRVNVPSNQSTSSLQLSISTVQHWAQSVPVIDPIDPTRSSTISIKHSQYQSSIPDRFSNPASSTVSTSHQSPTGSAIQHQVQPVPARQVQQSSISSANQWCFVHNLTLFNFQVNTNTPNQPQWIPPPLTAPTTISIA